MLSSIDIRGYLTKADTTNKVRLIVFQWKVPMQYHTPTAANILENYAGDGTLDLVRDYNYDNRKSFRILYDKLYSMNSTVESVLIKTRLRRFTKKLQYDGAGTNHQNGVYVMLLSDSAAASHPQLDLKVTKYYTDS